MERTQQVLQRLERLVFSAALKSGVIESSSLHGGSEDETALHIVWDPVIKFVVIEGLREMIELNSHRIGLNALLRRTYALNVPVDERSLDGLRECLVGALCDEDVFGIARVIEIDGASYLIWRVSEPIVRLKIWKMYSLSSKRSSELTVGRRWRERIEAEKAALAADVSTFHNFLLMTAATRITNRLMDVVDHLGGKDREVILIESLNDSEVAGGKRNGADELFQRLNAEQRDLRESDLAGLAHLLFTWCEANDLVCSLSQLLVCTSRAYTSSVQMVVRPK